MENKHLITVEQFKELARPTSKHVDDDDVTSFIEECEDIYIIPAIGLDKMEELLQDDVTDCNKILLEGGTYEKDSKKIKCSGLQKTLSYFVYAKMAMSDGSIITRSGLVQHNDSYAQRMDEKIKVKKYDDVMNVAETYLNSSLEYLRTLTGYGELKKVRGTRLRIHSIGE